MWKVPANAASGATALSRSRGRRVSSRLTFTWAPSGTVSSAQAFAHDGGDRDGLVRGERRLVARGDAVCRGGARCGGGARRSVDRGRRSGVEQALEHGWGDVGEHGRGGDVLLDTVEPVAHVPLARDAEHLGAGDELGAGLARGAGELAGHRAHAADRDIPVAGAAADHVVEEAAVRVERGVVEVGERADQAVGRDDAADEVAREAGVDGLAEGPVDELLPDAVVAETRARASARVGSGSVRVGKSRSASRAVSA